jgi:hypothetical protein
MLKVGTAVDDVDVLVETLLDRVELTEVELRVPEELLVVTGRVVELDDRDEPLDDLEVVEVDTLELDVNRVVEET